MNQEQNNNQAKQELQLLLAMLPDEVRSCIKASNKEESLLEIVMDLGRQPTARYVDGEFVLRQQEVSQAEIDQVIDGIGNFDDDNRAGITRTLHRISGIRNRRGQVVGLTCRVGRAVFGTIDIISDIVEQGYSILLLGRPGVGKTTMLREMARILAEKKRVVIVDTSNEIGGDGDIPHPAVGHARRMQVPRPSHQHETMIEAVENHSPEVIVIDEIGREQEALAARTINERGVQLIGTAHGNTLENLLLNPTLSDLVGGIESVTLSDEEARRRGTQKTVLERRAPPTFDVLIEIQDREQLLIHEDVTQSVDLMLRGVPLDVEARYHDALGAVQIEKRRLNMASTAVTGRREHTKRTRSQYNGDQQEKGKVNGRQSDATLPDDSTDKSLKIYAYGVARNRLKQAAKQLGVRVNIVNHLSEADVLVTLKSYYRKHRQLITDAERRRTPVYVLRANTVNQMQGFLTQAYNLELDIPADPFEAAIADAEAGIGKIQAGQSSVDLRPTVAPMRRYQHQLVRQAELVSHSYGKEPRRYVRIFKTARNIH